MATLILRPRGKWKVAIDGSSGGSLKGGDHAYEVAPGDHLVEVSVGGEKEFKYVTVGRAGALRSGGTTVVGFGHFGEGDPFEFRIDTRR